MALISIPPDVAFIALAIVTIAGSIMALEAKELIYGAVALAVSFMGVAGFFVFLDAPYLAMLQISIYVGAVVVLIVFTVMLVRRETADELADSAERSGAGGVWLSGLLAVAVAGIAALAGPNLPTEPQNANLPVSDLGPALVSQYSIPLIILGLLMSVALLGALILAKVER